jgi:hypothetical protein
MRTKITIVGLMLLSVVGCSGMSNAEKGMLGGAGAGTAIGAIAGRGNPAAMAIGAVAGTVLGGVAGDAQDRREDRREHQRAVNAAVNAQAARQMSLEEIVQMAQTGTPDHLIIRQIETTGSNFNLRGDDIVFLRQQRVSDGVIGVMQMHRAPRAVVVQPQPVVLVPAPPPPPVFVEPGVSVGVYGRVR